ncbi:hypothetical protein CTAYLR_006038 [Chrysophaeum taylorii]|uniref:Ras-related protein Rab-1 n=1 Tax=Chrysophaeum taylorii TaxID=2483200 RepID=A0AAD7ULL8_9STRA|nr:hypothetical protein CTAYLR_006038 [Chrysophaeum taylorii]
MHVKLLMLGDSGVGKTCLLLRYAYDSFSPLFLTTIGIDFKIKEVELDGLPVKLQIWDTAGQERFRTITVSYFKGAHGIILVYDVSERDSFENIEHWVQQIREHAHKRVRLVLVGNKCDKESRVVSTTEGEELAQRYGVSFFETSAKSNKNVDECYAAIARQTRDSLIELEDERRKAQEMAVKTLVDQRREKRGRGRRCCG